MIILMFVDFAKNLTRHVKGLLNLVILQDLNNNNKPHLPSHPLYNNQELYLLYFKLWTLLQIKFSVCLNVMGFLCGNTVGVGFAHLSTLSIGQINSKFPV